MGAVTAGFLIISLFGLSMQHKATKTELLICERGNELTIYQLPHHHAITTKEVLKNKGFTCEIEEEVLEQKKVVAVSEDSNSTIKENTVASVFVSQFSVPAVSKEKPDLKNSTFDYEVPSFEWVVK